MAHVDVAPDLLRWARDRAGVPIERLTKKFKKYTDWEEGKGGPTLLQLEALSGIVNLPIGMFFLPEAPVEQPLPLPDFRRMAAADASRPSTELIDTIHTAQLRQDWYRAHLLSNGAAQADFVGSATIDDDISLVAGIIRAKLGLEVGERSEASNWSEFLRQFIGLARQAGILVMINGVVGNNTHRPLDPQEFRGFAIADAYAPLIFVNGKDTKAGQIFTLAHEIAHIWLGETGVSHVRPDKLPASSRIEAWCNKVAAEILVPMAALRAMQLSGRPEDDKNTIARVFRVSTLVALRRLWELGSIDDVEFRLLYDIELDDLIQRDRRKSSGGDFYNTMGARVDPRFAAAVIGSAFEGHTLMGDALNLLSLKSTDVLRKEAGRLGVAI